MADGERLVLLLTVTNDIERAMVMGLLQTEHILALAQDARDNCGMKPYFGQSAVGTGMSDVQIYVYERDYAQAKSLVAAYHNQGLAEDEEG